MPREAEPVRYTNEDFERLRMMEERIRQIGYEIDRDKPLGYVILDSDGDSYDGVLWSDRPSAEKQVVALTSAKQRPISKNLLPLSVEPVYRSWYAKQSET